MYSPLSYIILAPLSGYRLIPILRIDDQKNGNTFMFAIKIAPLRNHRINQGAYPMSILRGVLHMLPGLLRHHNHFLFTGCAILRILDTSLQ